MSDGIVRRHQIFVSRRKIAILFLVALCAVSVFMRMYVARSPFSFDYDAYISIIMRLGELSFSDITRRYLVFPYTVVDGIVPIEFGFTLLVSTIAQLGFTPEITYALIASISVGLRVYAMSLVRVPVLWILWLNIYAITLFEANAIRLGLAVSILLYGLVKFHRKQLVFGCLAMSISLSFHLQAIFYIAPFTLFFLLSGWISRSKYNFALTLAITCIVVALASRYLPMLPNEKLALYVNQGDSKSAGVSVTSLLSMVLLVSVALVLRKRPNHDVDSQFFSAVVSSCVPSLVLLVFLNNIAVVGDRAWQLSIMVFSTFLFTNWGGIKSKQIPIYILFVTTLVMQINVTIRYPLSNFFSPPLPSADFVMY